MKPYLYLCMIVTALIILPTISLCEEEGEWEIMLDEFYIWDIAHDGDYVWCATWGKGLIRYDKTDGSYLQYTTENGLPDDGVIHNYVYSVVIDKNKVLWVGGARGVASFDGKIWKTYASPEIGHGVGFRSSTVDHNNVKWFTSDRGIVAYNDTCFYSIIEYGEPDDIYVDSNNTKWFAAERRLRYDNIEWVLYPREEERFYFYSIAVDSDNRQFLGGEGLRIYEGDEFITYTEMFGHELSVNSLAVDSHNIKWIGTSDVLFRYDDVEFKLVFWLGRDIDTYYSFIRDISIDDDGSVWFIAEGNEGILIKYTPEDTTTHVEKEQLPKEITLHQAHPNPFNPATTISYEIPFDAEVRLVVYDILGREITVLQDGMMSAGAHSVVWNGRDSDGEQTGSGVYIYRLVAGEHTAQGKMLLMR